MFTSLLDGQTLRERIAGKPLELPAVLALTLQVADALEAAHAKGIIHRDIRRLITQQVYTAGYHCIGSADATNPGAFVVKLSETPSTDCTTRS